MLKEYNVRVRFITDRVYNVYAESVEDMKKQALERVEKDYTSVFYPEVIEAQDGETFEPVDIHADPPTVV